MTGTTIKLSGLKVLQIFDIISVDNYRVSSNLSLRTLSHYTTNYIRFVHPDFNKSKTNGPEISLSTNMIPKCPKYESKECLLL